MDKFTAGWQLAVNWIYKESLSKTLSIGYNPNGREVRSQMMALPDGHDAGFAEGLIYAIGKPIAELRGKLIANET